MRLTNALLRLRALISHREMDEELDEELQFHLEMQARKNQADIPDVIEARRRARLQFGSFERATEACREARGVHLLETLFQDLRYGTRTLLKAPGFTVVAVLTLALGIGANSAIFSAVHSVLLKDLPVREPEKLKLLDWSYAPGWHFPEKFQLHSNGHWETDSAGRPASESFPLQFQKEFRSTKLFSTLFGFSPPSTVNASGAMTFGQLVSGEFFSGLGIQPELGRLIDDHDDAPGSAQVAVISYRFWRDHFDSDPNIVGRQLTFNNHPLTIVGVAPKGFFSAQAGVQVDVYAPLYAEDELRTLNSPETRDREIPFHLRPNVWWVQMMGRLAPGIGEKQAQAELTSIFRQQLNAMGVTNLDQSGSPRVDVRPGSRGLDELKERFAQPLVVLAWIVGLVLLIACGNVANLLLVRGTNRSREIALRLSLGASRARVLRQLLTESFLLSVTGAALGLMFAVWMSHLLLGLLSPPQTRFTLDAQLDAAVIGFSALIAVVTALIFGMVPAMRSGRVELTSALKTGRSSTLAKPQSKLSRGLVAAQVATSVLLLMGAGLFVRTLSNLRATDLGFDRNNLLLFAVDPELKGYKGQQLKDLLDEISARLQLVPGVRSVAFTEHPAISGNRDGGRLVSDLPTKSTETVNALYNTVGSAYFQTMSIRLLEGRTFDDRDTGTSAPVALLNKDLATKLFGNESPIGHIVHKDRSSPTFRGDYQIIGVVSDAKYASLTQPAPTLYMSYKQAPDLVLRWSHFVVRTWTNPHSVIADVRHAIAQIDPQLPIYGVITQTEQIDLALRQQRMFADLVSTFGILALVLASIGLYGVMAYSVSRRTQEIGIRLALGATRSTVSGMVLREGLVVVLIGIAIGIPAAIGLMRLITSLLWNVKPFDPSVISAAAAVLLVVALLAVAVPAYRATRIDPMEALRCE